MCGSSGNTGSSLAGFWARNQSTTQPRELKMKPQRTGRNHDLRYAAGVLALLSACIVLSAVASNEHPAPEDQCCAPGLVRLSPKEVKARLRHSEPIEPPCCAQKLNLKGTLTLEIAVDADGAVTCVRVLKGHPLLATPAIHSVSKWKFGPSVTEKSLKSFCGKLGIRFHATERRVKYAVTEVR